MAAGHDLYDPRGRFFTGCCVLATSLVTAVLAGPQFAALAGPQCALGTACMLWPYCRGACCCLPDHTLTIKTDDDRNAGDGSGFFNGYARVYTVSTKKLAPATLDAIASYSCKV